MAKVGRPRNKTLTFFTGKDYMYKTIGVQVSNEITHKIKSRIERDCMDFMWELREAHEAVASIIRGIPPRDDTIF